MIENYLLWFKIKKRKNTQSIKNGVLTGISQKVDKEYEIISCGINTNFYVWDFYKIEPVKSINENMMTVKISHNGKYFALSSSSGELWLFSLHKYEFMGKS